MAERSERTASIDDLLGYEEEAPAAGPVRTGTGAVVKAVLLGAAVTAAVVGGLRLAGIVVPIALVAVGVGALLALRHILRLVAPPAGGLARATTDLYEAGDAVYHWPTPDAMRRAVVRWEQRLTWHGDTPGTFDAHLRPALRELVDERTRQHDGFTIDSDPARARAVLGEPLWGVLTGEHRRGPGQRELTEAVARLEEL
jgi:hypothetical protein